MLPGDRELVRVLCPHCGSKVVQVVRDADRQLVMLKNYRTWNLEGWTAGTPTKAVHVWERDEMDEALMASIQTGAAGTRNRVGVAYCSCQGTGKVKLSIDYRSLAPYLAAAERDGGLVKWKLNPDDGEFARIWNRQIDLTRIPDEENKAMRRRLQELDPTAYGPMRAAHLAKRLADPNITQEERQRLTELARSALADARRDAGRQPAKPPRATKRAQR
jgi:hypothetical protein